jgi:hypothetical protein
MTKRQAKDKRRENDRLTETTLKKKDYICSNIWK